MDVDLAHERPELTPVPKFREHHGPVAPTPLWWWWTAVSALLGTIFAGISTADFIEHLDRQVHSIHCSFVPGVSQELGESGCRTIMMSPYSSWFRTSLWGGLPISLFAFAVFAYLAYRSVDFALKRDTSRRESSFLLAAALLPALMSVVYAFIATSKVGAVCNMCVAIYLASGSTLFGAVMAYRSTSPSNTLDSNASVWGRWFGEGLLYVAVLTLIYIFFQPQSPKTEASCGTLAAPQDPAQIMLHLGGTGAKSIALLDPLCPACKGFDGRLAASGLREKLDLSIVLFPLDASCNWMVKDSIHPGACMLSEAMLCSPQQAQQILDWSFAQQAELLQMARANPADLRTRITQAFPEVSNCLGSPQAKNRLNKSLRWAVNNALLVLTPQLFVNGQRICDEDTDLGLEYTLSALLSKGGQL